MSETPILPPDEQPPEKKPMVATAASKIGINSSGRARKLADVTLFLTLLTMVPYDKEVMQIIPPDWSPYIIKIGIFAQIALRYVTYKLQQKEEKEES